MHTPVLLKQALENLQIQPGGKYIDATLGEGGHLREIEKKGGIVLGIDWDSAQVERLSSQIDSKNIKLVQGNYGNIESIAKENGFEQVDGVLFDLGLSMEQLNSGKKGFSYKKEDELLDMRIGDDTDETAADLLNTLTVDSLYDVFAKYSEDLDSKIIAETVVEMRKKRRFERVGDLVRAVRVAQKNCQQKHQHTVNSTMARIFQALRVQLNNEFENIRNGLEGALRITKKNGRVEVITFHSLEDRVVKQFVRSKNLVSEQIKGDKEISFERSATLRIITV
ncbi:MAG: 16S rRNA (cytosine(1402)-N(4))-methyltransferase RsmH [Patescibacteria group bacterium]